MSAKTASVDHRNLRGNKVCSNKGSNDCCPCASSLAGHPWADRAGLRGQTTTRLLQAVQCLPLASSETESYMICSLGPGMLTTVGLKNTGRAGASAAPRLGPVLRLRLPAWAAQGPQDTGAGIRLPYWPKGGAGRQEMEFRKNFLGYIRYLLANVLLATKQQGRQRYWEYQLQQEHWGLSGQGWCRTEGITKKEESKYHMTQIMS